MVAWKMDSHMVTESPVCDVCNCPNQQHDGPRQLYEANQASAAVVTTSSPRDLKMSRMYALE